MLSTNSHYRLMRLASGSPHACLASPLMRRLEALGFIEPTGRVHPGTDLIEYRITSTGRAELSAPDLDARPTRDQTAAVTAGRPDDAQAA